MTAEKTIESTEEVGAVSGSRPAPCSQPPQSRVKRTCETCQHVSSVPAPRGFIYPHSREEWPCRGKCDRITMHCVETVAND